MNDQNKPDVVSSITAPDGTFKLSLPCSCGQQAKLQMRDGVWYCPYCRCWLAARDGEAVAI